MKVNEVMTRGVECVQFDDTLQSASSRMKILDVGSLPVQDNGQVVGVITDRDITIRAVADGHDPKIERVRRAMTTRVVACYEDQEIDEAAQIMRDEQVRRLPVLSRDKKLVGIISLGDVAVETGDEKLAGHALEGISEPSAFKRSC